MTNQHRTRGGSPALHTVPATWCRTWLLVPVLLLVRDGLYQHLWFGGCRVRFACYSPAVPRTPLRNVVRMRFRKERGLQTAHGVAFSTTRIPRRRLLPCSQTRQLPAPHLAHRAAFLRTCCRRRVPAATTTFCLPSFTSGVTPAAIHSAAVAVACWWVGVLSTDVLPARQDGFCVPWDVGLVRCCDATHGCLRVGFFTLNSVDGGVCWTTWFGQR